MDTNNLRAIRQRLRLSQAEFGKCIGVTKGNVSHYERQRQGVPPDVARRVIEVAKDKGVSISFDDIYTVGTKEVSKRRTGGDRRKGA